MNKSLLFLWLMAMPLMAAETGYRIVHPDGTVEFTDDPHRGGEEIQLREAPTFQSLPVAPSQQSGGNGQPVKNQGEEEVSYESIAITAPQHEQTIWFDGNAVSVGVSISPRLGKGHFVVLTMDGTEVGRGAQTSFSLPEVFRGSHTLRASVVDESGNNLINSAPVTFFMRRRSVN